MGNGAMFCTIKDYKKQAYYDQYPTMTLFTPDGDYQVEFFAGIIVSVRQRALPCFYMQFEDDGRSWLTYRMPKADLPSSATCRDFSRVIVL